MPLYSKVGAGRLSEVASPGTLQRGALSGLEAPRPTPCTPDPAGLAVCGHMHFLCAHLVPGARHQERRGRRVSFLLS